MCFSAEASFVAAGILTPGGVYCIHASVKRLPKYLPLALVPVFFALQQFSEGLVWVGLQNDMKSLGRWSSLIYLFFALAFWPFWFSLAGAFIESNLVRRRLLMCWAVLSMGWFWRGYFPLAIDPSQVTAKIVQHSIHYDHANAAYSCQLWTRGLYILTAAVPLLIMSERRKVLLAVVAAVVTAAVATMFFDYAFISIWCFFAALVSAYCVYMFASIPAAPLTQPAG